MGQGFCEGLGTSLHEVVVLGSSRESISSQARYAVFLLPSIVEEVQEEVQEIEDE